MRALIIGCGYVGKALAEMLARGGHAVACVRRSPITQPDSSDIKWIQGDITAIETLRGKVEGFDWVVNTVSSSRGELADYEAVYREGNRNLLMLLSGSPPKKYLWTSSTSVYGQMDGSIVDESSPAEPSSRTSQVLAKTEAPLLQEKDVPVLIARVAGIYGPGRGHLLQQYLRGEAAIVGEGERFLNMVHVDDVAGAITALLERGQPGNIYNIVDDEPVTEVEFFKWLSARLQKPMPPLAAADKQKERKRGLTSKRVSNVKLKSHTAYKFRYPTFREGYAGEMLNKRGLNASCGNL